MIVKFTLPSASVVVLNSLPPILTTASALGSLLSAVTTTLLGLPSALASVSIWSALTCSTSGAVLSPAVILPLPDSLPAGSVVVALTSVLSFISVPGILITPFSDVSGRLGCLFSGSSLCHLPSLSLV